MLTFTQGKILFTLALSLLFNHAATAADNVLTSEEIAADWELLFNGLDMSQWRNYKKDGISSKWVVRNGTMTLNGRGAGDLITKKKYKNFDLKMDWKISEAGNSGIFILADEEGRVIYLHAPEIQILDNEKHADNKKDNHLSGSLYDMIASPAESHRAAGQWNQQRVLLQDRHLRIWHNAVLSADITIGGSEWKRLVGISKFRSWQGFGENVEGYIGLQDHGDEVSFKNLKIRALD